MSFVTNGSEEVLFSSWEGIVRQFCCGCVCNYWQYCLYHHRRHHHHYYYITCISRLVSNSKVDAHSRGRAIKNASKGYTFMVLMNLRAVARTTEERLTQGSWTSRPPAGRYGDGCHLEKIPISDNGQHPEWLSSFEEKISVNEHVNKWVVCFQA